MSQNESKIKHLEFIQLTITRMNVNSFMVKGWLVTLVAAIFVLSEKDANTNFLWYSPIAATLFYSLDAYFVSIERSYRALYNHVRMLPESKIDFSMDISKFQGGKASYFLCICSSALLLFYPAVILISIIAAALIK